MGLILCSLLVLVALRVMAARGVRTVGEAIRRLRCHRVIAGTNG